MEEIQRIGNLHDLVQGWPEQEWTERHLPGLRRARTGPLVGCHVNWGEAPPTSKQVNLVRELLLLGKYSQDEILNFHYLRHKLVCSPSKIRKHLTINFDDMHGNPVFKGTRLPLYRILEELAGGTRLEELTEDYPVLSREALEAGLDFARSLVRVFDD